MNNAYIALQSFIEEEKIDTKPLLRRRLGELTEIYEALKAIRNSKHWKLLEEKVWTDVGKSLQRKLQSENNLQEINRLQGQIQWCNKYLNLAEVEKSFINEIEIIKSQINADSTSSED